MRLGVDFGTCYSSAALLIDSTPRPIKEPLKQGYSFPSSIYLTEEGEILVGQAAENKRQKNPQRYRNEFKRKIEAELKRKDMEEKERQLSLSNAKIRCYSCGRINAVMGDETAFSCRHCGTNINVAARNKELIFDEPTSFLKKILGQLRDHQQWVRNHSEAKTIYTAFVGLLLPPSLSSNPDPDMDVIELKEFKAISQRLRAALEDICSQALPTTLPQKIFEVFKQRDLLWPELYRNIEKSKLQELRQK